MTTAFLLMLMGFTPGIAQPTPSVLEIWMTAAPAQIEAAERIEQELRESLALQQSA